MYEMLLTYDDVIDPEVLDDVMTLLSDTNWLVVTLDAVYKYSLIVKCFWYVCDTLPCRVFLPGRATLPQYGPTGISCVIGWESQSHRLLPR